MGTPMFTHDCGNPDCCKYLGSTNWADVYSYKSALDSRGVIARWSSDGPDYHCWPLLSWLEVSAPKDPSWAAVYEIVKAAEEFQS